MPRIFFASKTIAQKIAIALDKPWDGSNNVELYTEEAGFEETVERLKVEWCIEGENCELSSAVRKLESPSDQSVWRVFLPNRETFNEILAQNLSTDENFFSDAADRVLGSLFALDESVVLRNRDELKQEILEVEGVPNVKYQVESDRCFVFDALLDRVRELQRANRETPIAELVTQALPDAWITAQKAVTEHNIVPLPYKLIELDGQLAILHEPFNAVLPPRFNHENERQEALAQILLGERLPGVGEFVFRGQAMTQLEPLDLTLLMKMPELGNLPTPEREIHPRLEYIRYHPEMPQLTQQQLNKLKEKDLAWETEKEALNKWVYALLELLWQLLPGFVSLLPYDNDKVPDYQEQNARAVRSLYPELQQLSDSALFWLYDSFEENINKSRYWEAEYRNDRFLFFLLGVLVEPEGDDATCDAGEFVGYALLRGNELGKAIAYARSCCKYDLAMRKLWWYFLNCQRYLEEVPDGSVTRLTGEKVGTFSE